MENRKYKSISVKNAKKIIFYFTSRLLFMILAIIFISYGCSMFVHADSEYTFTGGSGSVGSVVKYSELFEDGSVHYMDYTSFMNYVKSQGIRTNLDDWWYNSNTFNNNVWTSNIIGSQSYITSDFINNLPIPLNISYDIDYGNFDYKNNVPFSLQNNNIQIFTSSVSSEYFIYEVYYLYEDSENTNYWNFLNGSSSFYNSNGEDYFQIGASYYTLIPHCRITYNVSSDTFSYNFNVIPNNSITEGYTLKMLFCEDNQYVYKSDSLNNTSAYAAFKNNNYENLLLGWNQYNEYIQGIIKVGFFDDIINPDVGIPSEPTEGPMNHLYFEDVQIGMTAQGNNLDLLSSSFVIGCDFDDYVKNNLDKFSVTVSYNVHMKDSNISQPDPNTVYSVNMPAKTFLNDVYMCSISEIFNNSPVSLSGYSDFMKYYNFITSTHSVQVKSTIFDGMGWFPTLLGGIDKMLGFYTIKSYDEANYTIFDFYIDVGVTLWENPYPLSGNASNNFIKRFDIKNGSESIINAQGLVNNNPWEGESDPNYNIDPYVPSSGAVSGSYGSSGGAIVKVGDTNVVVTNSGQKIPLNVQSEEELESVIQRYGHLQDTLHGYFVNISDEASDNNFFDLLGDTLPMIPYLDFMLECAMCVIGLGVILFVLKVLLR